MTSKAKRAVMLGAMAALGAMQAGCDFEDPCTANNGNNKVLNFVVLPAAQGMQTQAILRRESSTMFESPFTFFTKDPRTCWALDDAKDEVQVDLPAALQSPPAIIDRRPGDGIGIRFTCNAPDGVKQKVTVRVVDVDQVTHEDTFDVTCNRVAQVHIEPDLQARGFVGDGYAVGGVLHALLSMTDPDGNQLYGMGAVPADDLLAPLAERQELYVFSLDAFTVAAPGQGPKLQVASFLQTVGVTLVAADQWTLQIQTSPSSSAGRLVFSAWPVAAGAQKLNGLTTCRWTAVSGAVSEVLPDTTCDIERDNKLSGGQLITQMCVEGIGRSVCVPVSG